MQITLRAGEEIFINGALLKVDRKVSIELVNNVTFLLGSHVLSPEEANTPLRQLYMSLQNFLIAPGNAVEGYRDCILMLHACQKTFSSQEIHIALNEVQECIKSCKWYQALKLLRKMFYLEDNYIGAMPKHTAKAG